MKEETDPGQAFKRIFIDKYYGRAVMFAYTLTKNMQQAEDITQDVYEVLSKKFNNKDEQYITSQVPQIQAYIFSAIKNKFLDHLDKWNRGRDNRSKYLDQLPEGYSQHLEKDIDAKSLMTIVDEIKNKTYREIIYLSIHGFPTAEIAELYDKSLIWARQKKHLAFKKLRTEFEKRNITCPKKRSKESDDKLT